MLSFNVSVSGKNKNELTKLNDYPFQIMPSGTSRLSTNVISQFPQLNNNKILIHVSYITRPFALYESQKQEFMVRCNLDYYGRLAERLGTKNILIHLPSNINEMKYFDIGINTIIDELIKKHNINVHLEVPVFSSELRKHLDIDKDNAYDILINIIDAYFEQIPKQYKRFFKLTPDTAHLYSNGVDGSEIVKFMKYYDDIIEFVHLNGNKNTIFTSDRHVPIYMENNKIKDVDKIMTYLSKTDFYIITENSTTKGTYKEWTKFCEKYNIKIVPFYDIEMC